VCPDEIELAQHLIEMFQGSIGQKRPLSDQVNGCIVLVGFQPENFVEREKRTRPHLTVLQAEIP
jgi:hypothetical protein